MMCLANTDHWILVKGSGGGGLGDRLRAVITALVYARATGRAVAVDWRDGRYGVVGENAFTRLFRIDHLATAEPASLEGIGDVQPPAWAGRLHRTMHEVYVEDGDPPWDRTDAIRRYSCDLDNQDDHCLILVLWDFDRLARLQRSLAFNPEQRSLDDLMSHVARHFIRPSPRIESRLSALLPPSNVRRIGVHVRATHESRRQKGWVELDRYWRVIDRRMSSDAEIFLATDNSEVEQRFRGRYPRVITQPKWFAPPGKALHLNTDCPDRARAAEEAVVDLLGLARTGCLITQRNTSFGIVARAFFAGEPGGLEILDPVGPHPAGRLMRWLWARMPMVRGDYAQSR